MPNSVINTTALAKTYIREPALQHVTFQIEEGESVALLGQNGSGKTTLINLLLGLIEADPPPQGGTSSLFGCSSMQLGVAEKQRIGFISDYSSPVPWATSVDIARLYAGLYRGWDQDRFEKLMEDLKIDPYRKLNALSKGQKRLAEIALVSSYHPGILVLDEPFNGLDALMRLQIQQMLRCMNQNENTTIFYSTHILTEVDRIAKRVLILRHGELVVDRLIAELPGTVEQCFAQTYGLADSVESAP